MIWVLSWRSTLALVEGRFGDAKRLAAEARDAAWINELSSTLVYRCQVQAARLEQGRNTQIADLLVAFLSSAPRWLQYHRAIRANALAELGGRSDEAHRDLAAFDALALQPRGWSWPFTLRRLAEASALLEDTARAAALVPLIEPYAGQLFVAYNGQVIEGSADRARAQCLATLGRLDEAIACYESGLALEESFGAPALAARTRHWLARALATRGAAGDGPRARAEAEAARDAATGFGMALLAEHAEGLAARLG
jgi:tetratricopeptide (TPR) repeat protein